ncbi:MAG: recombination-associated protein RdgC, partial [Arenimonas sp.]
MFFRNIVLFALPEIHRLDLETLENVLSAHALKPVGPLAMQSRGFVPPLGSGAYVQRAGHCLWLSLGGEDRILPSAVVHREWQAKIAKLEDTKGHPLGKRARSQLKQETLDELMPRAFVKPSHTHAVIDPKAGIIAIDTSSVKAA